MQMDREYLERLEGYHFDERWLVQAERALRVVWVLRHDDRGWLAQTHEATRPWHGPIHPRIATIYSSALHAEAVLFEVDDDRGPTLAEAAQALADPIERERWAVAQILAIANGLAALHARDHAYVYRYLHAEQFFVDEAGHARLRAPMHQVPYPPTSRTGGADLNAIRYVSPEQAQHTAPTAASDVFSLAINLQLALTGRRPFEEESGMAELVRILRGPPEPIVAHAAGLQDVLARAFVKDPASRIPDPGTFAGELGRCVPDAVDYDAVISDRIVAWRASLPAPPPPMFADVTCRLAWDAHAPTATNVRRCTRCDQDVVRVRGREAPVPLVGMQCRRD
jgi:hypothetical protein